MAQCEVCGNDYSLAFQVITAGVSHTFDCFECAAHKLAPICEHCNCKILGHGMEAGGRFYCSAHCANASGSWEIVDNADHFRGRGAETAMGAPTESWRGSGLAEDVAASGTERRAAGEGESGRAIGSPPDERHR